MNFLQQALGAAAKQQAERDQLRQLLQAANTPVSDSDIALRMQQELDANAFPLDTPSGQVLNPQLAALIASGMGMAEPQQSTDPLAGIPIGIEDPIPTGVSPRFPQNGGVLQNMQNSFRALFEEPAVATAAPVAQQAMVAPPMQSNDAQGIAALLGNDTPAQGMQQDTSAIAAALSGGAPAEAPQQGMMAKLWETLNTPYMRELLLQTGAGLSQSQPFGQAVATGVEKARARQTEIDSLPAAQKKQAMAMRKFESDINKTDAESGKLTAEALKLMKELEGGEGLSENDYAKVFTDMQKHVSSDIFRMAEDSPFKLDSETYARYLTNSGLKPESRRYGPLKAEYGDLMSTIWNDVQTGKEKQSTLESRIDEFEVAFGPQQTAKLLLQLQGK